MTGLQLPAHLLGLQVRNFVDDVSANLGQGSPPYVSLAGNKFTLIYSAEEEEPAGSFDSKKPEIGVYLDAIIVDANEHLSKIYYDKAFDPSSQQYEPPACFSDNGIAPSRSAAKPQSVRCGDCQWSAWGSKVSAVSGKGIKACHDQQKLALMVPGNDTLFLLRVPPNSLANLRTYVNKFKSVGVPMQFVITRIYFVSQGTLNFVAPGGYTGEAEAKRLATLGDATAMLVGRTDQPRQEALAAPSQVTALPAPQTPSAVQPAAVTTSAASTAPQGNGAPAAGQLAQPEPATRRRRRTTAAAETAQPAGTQAPAQAGFTAFQPEQGNGNGASFGMQAPAATPGDIEQTLDSIFGSDA